MRNLERYEKFRIKLSGVVDFKINSASQEGGRARIRVPQPIGLSAPPLVHISLP
jgi:hypothetical protein